MRGGGYCNVRLWSESSEHGDLPMVVSALLVKSVLKRVHRSSLYGHYLKQRTVTR